MNRWYFAVVAAMAAFLTACGGGGGKAPVASNPAPVVAAPAPVPAPATGRLQVETPAATEKLAELAGTVAPSPSLAAAAHVAAKATPVRGSLHMSSTGNAPVTLGSVSLEDAFLTTNYRVYGKPWVQTHHYWNQAITVDYDGDGANEYKLTVEEDSFLREGVAERGSCDVAHPTSVAVGAGGIGDCTALVGQPDRFMIMVYRTWTAAGLIDNSERDHDITFGRWYDRDTGHVGVFWSGPSIDNPHPLDNPINGRARIFASGNAFLNDGALVEAQAGGELHLDLNTSIVTLELGKKEQAHHRDGIKLIETGSRGDANYGAPFPEHHIPGIFTYREAYDPSRSGFGRDVDKQLDDKNDVTSGNGSGQFAGVITKRPRLVDGRTILVPAVFGTVGLTEIQSLEDRLEGLSLLMLFQSGVFCASDAGQSGCR